MLFSCKYENKSNFLEINLIKIPAGNYVMGDSLGSWDENPIHQVNISNSFYISETEITAKQFHGFKKDYRFSEEEYAIGVSWYEANEFCIWLSKKEGKNYRLPTEAEWEYICKAEGNWGVMNMLDSTLEWCNDWYGDYQDTIQTNPIGIDHGIAKVVRGGLPDDFIKEYSYSENYYSRPTNRSGMPPNFRGFTVPVYYEGSNKPSIQKNTIINQGLTGIVYDDLKMTAPLELYSISNVNSTGQKWISMNNWAAKWQGMIVAPVSGKVTFKVISDYKVQIEIAGESIISGKGKDRSLTGVKYLKGGEKYPILINYIHDGGNSLLKLFWSWEGKSEEIIPKDAFTHNDVDKNRISEEYRKGIFSRYVKPSIGFRIVQAPELNSKPTPYQAPFIQQGIKEKAVFLEKGSLKPYFRKRYLHPLPLDHSSKEEIIASGLHPSFGGHNHHSSTVVCSNGDLLTVYFISVYEDAPEVSLMASRLRYGSDEWDMPTPLIDLPDVNDVSSLLWNDDGKIYLFWGNIHLKGGYPFQWIESTDNGATFSQVKFPKIERVIDGYTPQPITSIFKDREGTIYLASDGIAAHSFLWASKDNGKTWFDTGGRTGGRHTAIVPQQNGNFYGVGGKKSDIEGFMPISISTDKGKSWEMRKSVFPSLGGGQRPALIRLKSGNLLFAGDFQRKDGYQPEGITERGAFAALSIDEGKTWKIKKIPGTLENSKEETAITMRGETLGYVSLAQGENGMIHLTTSTNAPALHFEFNEAWIESNVTLLNNDNILMRSASNEIDKIKTYTEKYSNGEIKIRYSGGITNDGRFLLNGKEEWYYKDGAKKYDAEYKLGKKTETEKYYSKNGKLIWKRSFKDNDFTWTQYWENGKIKSESYWKNKKCNGIAKRWDNNGVLISNVKFNNGKIIN
jgi:antitoxin component YwqK of YwqJK toxin-antitoxin module